MVYTSTQWLFNNLKQLKFNTDTCYSCKECSKKQSADDIVAMDEGVGAVQYSRTRMCVDAIRATGASVPDSHDVK